MVADKYQLKCDITSQNVECAAKKENTVVKMSFVQIKWEITLVKVKLFKCGNFFAYFDYPRQYIFDVNNFFINLFLSKITK